jgi:hypothetical protein
MSNFGAAPINLANAGIDYLVSSVNKRIEGGPAFLSLWHGVKHY